MASNSRGGGGGRGSEIGEGDQNQVCVSRK